MLNVISGVHGAPVPPVTNSYESIQTYTVGAGGSSSITFSSIPSTYKHLQLRIFSTYNTAVDSNRIRFNSDTGSNYSEHGLLGDGASASAFGSTNTTSINVNYLGSGNLYYTGAVVDILDYSDTNKYKTVRGLGGFDKNGSGYVTLLSGNWRNTAAVNTLNIFPSAGTWTQYSSFALYGIKG